MAERIVVAIDASKEITKNALEWALTNVAVQEGHCITLLALFPSGTSVRKVWGFSALWPLLGGDCGSRIGRVGSIGSRATQSEIEGEIQRACSTMMQDLHNLCAEKKIDIRLKVVQAAGRDVTASEAKKLGATWVVLDRHLKREAKNCKEHLDCNIVLVKQLEPKILRLNLRHRGSYELPAQGLATPASSGEAQDGLSFSDLPKMTRNAVYLQSDCTTPSSSPDEIGAPFTPSDQGISSNSSSETSNSPYASVDPHLYKHLAHVSSEMTVRGAILEAAAAELIEKGGTYTPSDSDSDDVSPLPDSDRSVGFAKDGRYIYGGGDQGDQDPELLRMKRADLERSSNVRKAILLSQNVMPGPPPLCSICQHKAPVFGKPPRRFSYAELELATAGFSPANFLAEGGYGSVHRGILPDGQAVAVKQHKLASTQGDKEFCSEVEVLSCAQHRNVVMLSGYCVEGNARRLLVYEFICNGALDSHLYDQNRAPLEWQSRQKIAVGAARGLRYLHEECRVGCIVHRDLRPNNILLTHDFEPLVGDFGLARWQPDGDCGVDTRVIGTFGYLAPEYTQSGQITEKADVYSFGVVLLELVTGRKAVDINRPKGEQCLTEWARPLLEEKGTLPVDPRLENKYAGFEVHAMLHTASCCIRRDPHHRPRMSQVLRMLEGEMIIDAHAGSPLSMYGSNRLVYEHPGISQNPKVWTNIAKPSSDHQSNGSSNYSSPNGYLLISSLQTSPRTLSPSSLPPSGRVTPEPNVSTRSSKLSFEALKAAYKEKPSYSTHGSMLAYDSSTAGKNL
ncbi:unnamed protein product [Sphagnum troendelagicum]|uniref:Protein kinase domain-containing protein n=1 Tax=Sphagnum troendelagicum TaxID=128251 RepID=A0ABP0UTZ5_9BRYO